MEQISDQDFDPMVLNAQGTFLVDFWAPWCGPCKTLMPLLEEALKATPNIKGYGINIDENTETPTRYNIVSIPTLILFREGKILDTHVGSFHTAEDISNWLTEAAVG